MNLIKQPNKITPFALKTKRNLLISITVIILFFNVPITLAFQHIVPTNELIENAKKYDGNEVYFKGEVIGDVMQQGKFFWLNLYDGNEAMGIWGTIDLLPKITYIGDYKHKGDSVLVKGIFHRACSEHNGEIDIHALELELEEKGYTVGHPFNRTKLFYAISFFTLTISSFLYYQKIKLVKGIK
ncbi:MAG: DNA-binding protein [bacterium]